MATTPIVLESFTPHHLDGAVALSQQAKWPHRREDWALALAVSRGSVATDGSNVVGTILVTPYGQDAATINMVIVDENLRGLGIGKQLMNTALEQARGRQCLLIATKEGLPLYKKIGFVEAGEIVQHQGIVEKLASAVACVGNISWADAQDLKCLNEIDYQATGFDRSVLMRHLREAARFAVLREQNDIVGFAAIREFGRGKVIGPVVAKNTAAAEGLISFMLEEHQGQFLRVDTNVSSGLAGWLTAQGLHPVGGGIAMSLYADTSSKNLSKTAVADAAAYKTFALVNQAFG